MLRRTQPIGYEDCSSIGLNFARVAQLQYQGNDTHSFEASSVHLNISPFDQEMLSLPCTSTLINYGRSFRKVCLSQLYYISGDDAT
jgi:hypothetical protein